MSEQFKAFVSEEQVQEERQKRQAEWERVRQPDDPKDEASAAAALPSQAGSATSRSSQKELLSGGNKRMSSDNKCETEEKNRRTSEGEASQEEPPDAKLMAGIPRNTGTPMVVAGILPGIVDYAESDSSTENESNSSDSENDFIAPPNVSFLRQIQDMLKKMRDGCL